jgi:hypothetical protein
MKERPDATWWFHVTGNTYGTWLPGDPRGWRSRGHRRHVQGDYRNPPPPGLYDALNDHSKRLLANDAVLLTRPQRQRGGQAMVRMLRSILEIELLALSAGRMHYHMLGRFSRARVKSQVGRAKKHASFELTPLGAPGRVWARGCRPLPIKNESHQRNAYRYILNHKREGAWVWSFREGIYWEEGISTDEESPGQQSRCF